jgi:hypothetical protein
MTEFKVGDEVEVLYCAGMGYQGNYKKGMKGKIILLSDKSATLQDDCYTPYGYWLPFAAIKLVETKYPNPPLPHCEERIAFAKGANIEFLSVAGTWLSAKDPSWDDELKYRVKVEKTKDQLRIEELKRFIIIWEEVIDEHKKELAELKPISHY